MQTPVVVGLMLAVVFLVGFTEWFYGMARALKAIVIDDQYFVYRMVGAIAASMTLMVVFFYLISVVAECPSQEREGLFSGLRCEEYLKIRSTFGVAHNSLYQGADQPL